MRHFVFLRPRPPETESIGRFGRDRIPGGPKTMPEIRTRTIDASGPFTGRRLMADAEGQDVRPAATPDGSSGGRKVPVPLGPPVGRTMEGVKDTGESDRAQGAHPSAPGTGRAGRLVRRAQPVLHVGQQRSARC
jgi:hypothetical protein